MILRQYESFSAATTDDHVSLGAQILHVCLDFDQLVVRGHSTESAWHWLSSRSGEYNPQVLAPLEDFRFSSVTYRSTVMSLARLEAGMVIDEDIRTNSGLLLVARGHETTAAMLVRLRNFRQSSAIPQTVRVLVLAPGIDSDDAPAAGTSAQSAATSL
jgi:hypothetical protein